MVRLGKCSHCRDGKQKCIPSQRIWVEGGEKQKCDRCLKYGHECGPNELPASRKPCRRRRSPSHQQASPPPRWTRSGPSIAGSVQCRLNNAQVENPLEFSVGDVETGNNKLELRRRVANLYKEADVLNKIQLTIEHLQTNGRQGEPHYQNMISNMISLKNAGTRELSANLALAESLADRVRTAGEADAAENAYNRILNVYRMLPIKAWHEVNGLLVKMANIFWEIEPLRAENLLWETLELGHLPHQARKNDLNVLKRLARSLPQTSEALSRVVQGLDIDPIPSNLTTPFPPLRRMMESKYARDVVGNVFQSGRLTDVEGLVSPIIGGIDAVREVLQELSPVDLQTQDLQGRSPLFMAAQLQMEYFGLALMLHVTELPNISRIRFTNSRDIYGQTILGIAIWRDCSLEFIEALIDHGAEVDPETLRECVWTPLQAAAWLGNSQVVDLLLRHEAQPGRIWPGAKTAEILAQEAGHHELAQLLQSHMSGG